MKRISAWLLGAIAVMLSITGCVAGSQNRAPTREMLSAEELPEAQALAANYVKAFSEAMQKQQFSILSAVLDTESEKRFTEAEFDKMCENARERYGTLTGITFLGELDQTLVRDYLWRFSFEKVSTSPDHDGELIRKDSVFLVRVGKLDGRYVIVGTGFTL